MNTIIKNLVKDFLKSEELVSTNEAKDFEHFCNYSIVSSEYKGDFSMDDIGMGETQGIDGIAIIINGNLVSSVEEIDDLVKRNNFCEAVFIFVQSKTSDSFNGADISNFFVSISDFLNDKPKSRESIEIKKAIGLKNKIWEYVSKMTKGKPLCKIYYVTTGVWTNDKSLQDRFENHKSDIENLSLFKKVSIVPCGADEIQRFYLQTKRASECEFTFDKKITLPVESGVKEAYYGIVKFSEFLKIISYSNDEIKDVFYENVRDFLGETNLVNKEIELTLDNKEFDKFCILNNGVTVVANSKTSQGDRFSIEGYQIVNGCQTSHVLYNKRKLKDIERSYIPLKLIVTDDENIQSKIIVATNRQTSIPKEQLEAFSKFQKDLELYYETESELEIKLFYERRQKQYRDKDTSRARIVTIREQIKSFAAMFLDQPHLASGHFSKVYTDNKKHMFVSGHKFNPYFISALTMYKIEYFIKNGEINKKYRIARYHILMIFRMLITKENKMILPLTNSREMENYCGILREILLDTDKSKIYFEKAIQLIDSIESINLSDQKTLYRSENTKKLKKKIHSK